MSNTVQIDQEFKSLIPPLQQGEVQQLEANIKRDGCREPLVTWDGLLLDGHNRYAICQKHDIPYETRELDLDDRDAAKEWIIQNQLGRRNLNNYQRGELALRLKPLLAKQAKKRQGTRTDLASDFPPGSAESQPKDTRDQLAEIAGVGHDTISKVAHIAEHGTDELKEKCRKGEMSPNAAHEQLKSKGGIKFPRHPLKGRSTGKNKTLVFGLRDVPAFEELDRFFRDNKRRTSSKKLLACMHAYREVHGSDNAPPTPKPRYRKPDVDVAPEDYIVVIPSYQRAEMCRDKTLAMLAQTDVSTDRIHVVVADEQQREQYAKTLARDTYSQIHVAEPGMAQVRNWITHNWPEGTCLLCIDDDVEVLKRRVDEKNAEPMTDLHDWIVAAFQKSLVLGYWLWGVYPVDNPHFMDEGHSVDLRYIVGCCWGYIVRHGEAFTVTGDDKEDHERTIQHYIADGGVVRWNDVCPQTKYWTNPGGMKTGRTDERVRARAQEIANRYPQYATLKSEGKVRLRDEALTRRRATPDSGHDAQDVG